MMCTRYGLLLQSILYRCIGCYGQVNDADMCKDCRREHIESNKNDPPEFIELRAQK